MKIVVATFTFHPEVDGVAMAAGLMVANFVAAGYEVHVATGPSPGSNADDFRGFEVNRFEPPVIGGSRTDNAYVNFLISAEADVLVFHCWKSWPTDLALENFTRIPGKKIMLSHGYDTHSIHWQRRFPWGLITWLKRFPKVLALPIDLKAFDRVVFLSNKKDFARFFDAWTADRIIAGNVRIIPNSIERDRASGPIDFRASYALGQGIVFLCVANYSKRKNQEMALDAYCKANIPNSSLVFIGSSLGSYGTGLKEKWETDRKLHPQLRAYFLENVSRQEVLAAFKACDVVLLSATAETQPIVLLEAMAIGKPFISTDTGCVSEFEGGVIVRNVDMMAYQMQQLASDARARNELGSNGISYYSAHHSPGVVNRAWIDLIQELTDI